MIYQELFTEFKNDKALQNALENKDKRVLAEIMQHRYNMSMHMYGFNKFYLRIRHDENRAEFIDIVFDEDLNIKDIYTGGEMKLNIKEAI